MNELTTTRPSLLLRIRDLSDTDAWRQFAELYVPLIERFALKNGIQTADAADLVQEVMQAVSTSIQRLDYDPRIGRFRSWLFTIARHKQQQWLSRRSRQPVGSGDSAASLLLQQHPQPQSEDDWDREYQQRLFEWASERVRPEKKRCQEPFTGKKDTSRRSRP